ncbi:hypothetical protein GF342_05680 [Candidatus Woesearchaeota archaeon]|nr:hypothetical protein [Candidatus Woesearchaeota archaeon]
MSEQTICDDERAKTVVEFYQKERTSIVRDTEQLDNAVRQTMSIERGRSLAREWAKGRPEHFADFSASELLFLSMIREIPKDAVPIINGFRLTTTGLRFPRPGGQRSRPSRYRRFVDPLNSVLKNIYGAAGMTEAVLRSQSWSVHQMLQNEQCLGRGILKNPLPVHVIGTEIMSPWEKMGTLQLSHETLEQLVTDPLPVFDRQCHTILFGDDAIAAQVGQHTLIIPYRETHRARVRKHIEESSKYWPLVKSRDITVAKTKIGKLVQQRIFAVHAQECRTLPAWDLTALDNEMRRIESQYGIGILALPTYEKARSRKVGRMHHIEMEGIEELLRYARPMAPRFLGGVYIAQLGEDMLGTALRRGLERASLFGAQDSSVALAESVASLVEKYSQLDHPGGYVRGFDTMQVQGHPHTIPVRRRYFGINLLEILGLKFESTRQQVLPMIIGTMARHCYAQLTDGEREEYEILRRHDVEPRIERFKKTSKEPFKRWYPERVYATDFAHFATQYLMRTADGQGHALDINLARYFRNVFHHTHK